MLSISTDFDGERSAPVLPPLFVNLVESDIVVRLVLVSGSLEIFRRLERS
jgi:hypothetical protein